MTVKELMELLDGVNPEYQVELDLPSTTLADSFISDPVKKAIYLETFQLRAENELIDLKDAK